MKKLILVVSIVVFGLSSYSFAAPDIMEFGSQGSQGLFCNIEGAEVCVMAQSEEDCKKLEGKKVDSCPQSQDEEK